MMPPRTTARRAALAGCCAALAGCGCSSGASRAAGDAATHATDAGAVPSLMDAVDGVRLRADLSTVAGDRAPGTAHWQAVQDLCAARLGALGYAVERQAYGTGVNVIGVRAGQRRPAERVIVSGHYDGVAGCPAADYNGSGVAATLEAARVLAARPFARTLVVACWDEEETGLVGSRAYAARARAAGETIGAVFVLEMIGYRNPAPYSQTIPAGFNLLFPAQVAQLAARQYRGDFIAVVHDQRAALSAAAMVTRGDQAGLPTVVLPVPAGLETSDLIHDLRRSDHAPFWAAGYPAVQLTDTANFRNPHYHCAGGADAVADVDVDFAVATVKALVGAAADALEPI